MPDDKYEFCGFEIVPDGESPRGTKAYAEAHKLKGRQRGGRPTYTATLRDYQTQLRDSLRMPGLMLEPKPEARPQDTAIWRAILVGEERFTFLFSQTRLLRAARRALLRDKTLFDAQARAVDFARLYPRHRSEKLFRFVLFTHPFTGGRAVFSELVD